MIKKEEEVKTEEKEEEGEEEINCLIIMEIRVVHVVSPTNRMPFVKVV